ncbi:glycoside hydrolase family 30 beta sandwich domain-containing protein [Actinoallomurus liliacearum]|uniref:Glycoside hydrolase family 30 beta sandwich domain-containing protein n=1 Tax=Actinoallomurus liliacearum TaxID=1080073 RepID=A0ABP8U1H9_9ACTN
MRPLTRSSLALALTVATTCSLGVPAHAQEAPRGRVDFRANLQPIDGFGFSEAFQRAAVIHGLNGLSAPKQKEVVDLLFGRRAGAGASILRLGIGSSADKVYDHMPSIEPADPGGPTAPPKYVWDGDDGGQVWLANQARSYGVRRFYADAWSAPGFMKTNGTDANGGTLCGLQGTDCASGDWRQAYANYLVQYARFYRREGIRITDLGFTNEPDITVSYASMNFTPAQAVEFVKVLGPVAKKAGLKLSCCDHTGWDGQQDYTRAIEADPQAARWVTTITGHAYSSPVTSPQPTRKRTWMSEWGPGGSTWNENWDDGTEYSGFAVAENIHRTMTDGNAGAYVYWLAASVGATRALIQLDGDAYHVSKRFWAFAAYSRFIRPGATRVAVSAADPALEISAYRNADGTKVVEILNTGTTASTTDLALGSPAGHAQAYLTDAGHSVAPVAAARTHGRDLSADLAPRSLTTVVLR